MDWRIKMLLTKIEKKLVKTFEAMKAAHYKAWLISCGWAGYPAPCPRCKSNSIWLANGPRGAYCHSCAESARNLSQKTWPIKGENK